MADTYTLNHTGPELDSLLDSIPNKEDAFTVGAGLSMTNRVLSLDASQAYISCGHIAPFAATTAPDGYLACDGSEYLKTDYPELADEVRKSHSAHEAQKIMHANIDKVKYSDEEKLVIMEGLLRLKIEQNPYVKKKLLETGDYTIVEDSPKDSYWGWGINRDGENQLGKLWMKLREEIKKQEK